MEIIRINRYQWPILAAAAFLLLVLQAGIVQAFAMGEFANFLLLFGIAAALDRPGRQVLIISLGLGILADFASGLPDGLFVLAFPSTLLALHFVLTRLLASHDSFFIAALTAVAAIPAFYAICFLVIFAFELLHLMPDYSYILVMRHLWLELFLNLLFFYPIYLYYRWVTHLALKAN